MKRIKMRQQIKTMTKINKTILTILFLIILQGCIIPGPYTSKGQRESWNKFIQSNSSDDWILVDLSEWRWKCSNRGCKWSRRTELYDYKTNMLSASGLSIYPTKKNHMNAQKELLFM